MVDDDNAQKDTRRLLGLDPVVAGTACCIASAFCYTGANICLRQLAGLGADEMWVTCMKELVAVVTVGPWLLFQAMRGVRPAVSRRAIAALALTALAVQFAGNVSVQWSFGVIGIAITVPVIFGVMLMASAVLGRAFLGEQVPGRSAAAIALLIVSIVLLSCGAGGLSESITTANTTAGMPRVLLGIGAACLGGAMYAALSTVIRSSVTGQVPVTVVVVIVTGMGVLSLGSLSAWRLGVPALLHTDTQQLAWMLGAGTFNLFGFLAITKGLQLTTVVRANLLNASQVAMAAIAGMLLFHESMNVWVSLGIALTIVGVLLIAQPAWGDKDEETEAAAEA